MSWDIVLFNSKEKINSIEELNENKLVPTDFCSVLENHFGRIIKNTNHREIKGRDYSIEYFEDNDIVSNKVLNLYGENGLYELVILARKYNWQIFDSGLRQMIDLENPSSNGFENFQKYAEKVLKKEQ